MIKNSNLSNAAENTLYNNILSMSRNRLFYKDFYLSDTFHNRINLIFLHSSFLFIKIKDKNKKSKNNIFAQKFFNLLFYNIELNMRELGFGDVNVNKNMKYLVRVFYNILLNCEKYKNKNLKSKTSFLIRYLELNISQNNNIIATLVNYFDKYESFCFDLSSDSVLSGKINFKNYK